MLVFDKRLLKTKRLNHVVVPVYDEDKTDGEIVGYLYSDLDTYRQATVIMTRCEGSLDALKGLMHIKATHDAGIKKLEANLPLPFKMFAPYLGLVSDNVELDYDDIEDLIGRLHVIGRAISFSDYLTIPAGARVNIAFGKSSFLMMKDAIEEYKIGLYEAERAEGTDGLYWVNSDEIERVGKITEMIAAAIGGFASIGGTATTVTTPVTVSGGATGDAAFDAALQKEAEDMMADFDPSEWAGYIPTKTASFGDNTPAAADGMAVMAEPEPIMEEPEDEIDRLLSANDRINETM